MSTPDDTSIEGRFAALSQGAAAYSAEVAAVYEKFMATGDVAGWDAYCRELQALREAKAEPQASQ